MKNTLTYLLFFFLFLYITIGNAQNALNNADFQTPPNAVKVNTWWHWISGNITKDGITRDLESMKQQGISQATILNVGSWNPMSLIDSPVKFYSEEWFEMYKWALQEANRLGITIGVHNCDGWSTSGGPWITPEKSMKQYVWSKKTLEGGNEVIVQLPQPQAVNNFYRDVAVVAFPIEENLNSYQKAAPNVTLNKAGILSVINDGNPLSELKIKAGEIIDISFSSLFAADKIVIFPRMVFDWGDMAKISAQFILSASNDGINYKKISDLELVGVNKSISISFPAVKSKYFKLECVNSWNNYAISELELLTANESPTYSPEIAGFLEKISSVKALDETSFDVTPQNNFKAIPENSIIDLSGFVSPAGVLKWKVPKGQWRVIRFGYTTTGKTNSPATPEGTGLEVDKMDTTALNIHFEGFAKKLIQASGQFTGNTFKFLLIDSWECFFQNWTQNFPKEFSTRRGYEITSWIPVLCGEVVENTRQTEAFLHDFNKTIADLIDVNYFKHFSKLCHDNQLEMHAEIIYGNDGSYPALDILKSNKYPDLPMTEFWATPNKNQFPDYQPTDRPTAGFPTYSALACNKQIIGSEAYTGYAHYSETPFDLKPFGDAAYCSGINLMILHSYVHQPFDKKPGVTLMQFAAHFNRNNPWWEYAQGWMDYQARIQYVLQKSEPSVDIIFYVGDQLPQYFSKSIINELPFGFQANACNFDMLKNEAKVINGKLSFGGKQSYLLLALPKKTSMDFATLQQIAELVKDGATVYGPKPLEMISLQDIRNNSAEFTQLVDALWGKTISAVNIFGKGKVIWGETLTEVLIQMNTTPDFATNSNNPKEIMYFHKKMDDTDVYYVFNQQNKPMNRELLFKVEGKTPEIWNPEDGSTTKPAIYSLEKNQTRIPVSFKPRESLIFVFRNTKPNNFINQVSLDGKQVFPQFLLNEEITTIPQAKYSNKTFKFFANSSGEYSFITNTGKSIKTTLKQPTVLEIDKFDGQIEFFPISDEAIQPVKITTLKSLTEFDNPAIKYFAGKAKYTIPFYVPNNFVSKTDSFVLNLGNIDAIAEVRLNGKFLKYVWMPNSNITISNLLSGENKLEITIANVCRNRFIGDLIQFGSVKSLFTTSPIATILTKDMPLKPSGLMGPISLTKYVKE